MGVKVFWCEPTNLVRLALRRFAWQDDCVNSWGYHRASREIHPGWPTANAGGMLEALSPQDFADSLGWPLQCDFCDYLFTEDDHRSVDQDRVYQLPDGRRICIQELPIGAMYDSTWLPRKGPDGIVLTVVIPPGEGMGDHWDVDSRANNCDRADDGHFCWVRHGDPRLGQMHVDKNGDTCSAGAGSIRTSSWHGYLHDNEVRENP